MLDIVAILPCKGRKEQTLECVKRLIATAGVQHNTYWKLVLVSGKEDEDIVSFISQETNVFGIIESEPSLTYWQALQRATSDYPTATHYIMLANDLLPAVNWLTNAIHKLVQTFPDLQGIVGFNGDGHGDSHSCHFMISSGMLQEFGGWPIWYHHNFGDTEFCIRANQKGRYIKAPYAILFHNHPWISAHTDDEIYELGRKYFQQDELLFLHRKASKWES